MIIKGRSFVRVRCTGWVFFIFLLYISFHSITLGDTPLRVYVVCLFFILISLHFARLFGEVNVNSEYIAWEYKALLFKRKGRRDISFFNSISIEACSTRCDDDGYGGGRRYFSVTLVPSNPCHVYDDFSFVHVVRLDSLLGERSAASFVIRLSKITGLPIRLDDTMYSKVNKDDIEQLLKELDNHV